MENVTLENVTLDRAVEVVRALTPGEQQQLRRLMDAWQEPQEDEAASAQERLFAEHLLAKGIITRIPDRYRGNYVPDNHERHPPIVVQGEPVSETIIRERR